MASLGNLHIYLKLLGISKNTGNFLFPYIERVSNWSSLIILCRHIDDKVKMILVDKIVFAFANND